MALDGLSPASVGRIVGKDSLMKTRGCGGVRRRVRPGRTVCGVTGSLLLPLAVEEGTGEVTSSESNFSGIGRVMPSRASFGMFILAMMRGISSIFMQ